MQQPGLTLAVQAAPFKGAAKEASVALTVELDGAPLEFAPQPNGLFADTLEVSFFALNDDGRAQRGTRAALNLAVRPETYQRVKALGVRLNSRTALAPGRYQLRVGARDPRTGKTGTVFYDITVPDFSTKPLMMSGVLLSSAETAGDVLTPQRDPAAEKLLGAPATSRREFAGPKHWRGWRRSTTTPSRSSRGRSTCPRASWTKPGATRSRRATCWPTATAARRNGQTFGYTGRIPLNDVAPGRYLLRVEAHDRSEHRPAARQLRKPS